MYSMLQFKINGQKLECSVFIAFLSLSKKKNNLIIQVNSKSEWLGKTHICIYVYVFCTFLLIIILHVIIFLT